MIHNESDTKNNNLHIIKMPLLQFFKENMLP